MRSETNRLLNIVRNLQNPLYIVRNLIGNHLEILDEDQPETDQQNSIGTRNIFRKPAGEINHVLETIRKLNRIALDFTNSTNVQKPVRKRVKIYPILEGVVQAFRSQHYFEHVMFVMSVPKDLPEIEVDSVDLEEMFYNFLINAVQAAPENGRLTVDAIYVPKAKPEIAVAFRDTGQGIPEDVLPYIFEPFFPERAGEGGVGFGLYIVKQLAERNAGRITVESVPGQGSIFRLFLPVAGFG